jgi:tetratricopeptide (TPR) repeat protein
MPLLRSKLTWSIVLLSLPLCAQSHGEHAEVPLSTAVLPNSVPVIIDRSSVHPAPARTISAELLRFPLSDQALHMLQKALKASDAGQHLAAIKQLQKTLAKFPDTGAYVYSLLGVEDLKTDQFPEAIDALDKSVKLLPHDASNHANLGLALISSGRYDRAETELRRALELDPHYGMASELLKALAVSRNVQK